MKRALGILITSCAAALICSPARATTTFSIQPTTINAAPGAVGDTFDVELTNNGPTSITVAAFAFEVSVTDTDITLTGANFTTGALPYIFAGHSFDQDNSLPLNFTSGQTLDGSDSYDVISSGFTLTAGQSVALGDVLFNVSPSAATGPFTVSFTGTPAVTDSNNLSDPSFNPITVNSFLSGTIVISSVPEPSSLLLALGGIVAVVGYRAQRWRRSRP